MLGLIIGKELREILSSPRFLATFAVVSALVLLTFAVGARDWRLARGQYEAAQAENLRQLEGQTDWLMVRPSVFLPPQPLASLVTGIAPDIGRNVQIVGRGTLRPESSRYGEEPLLATFRFLDLEFLFTVVLSLFAILFAHDAISGEKERGTLRLALAGAVPRDRFILGKLIGTALALTVPLLIPFTLGALLWAVLGVPLSGAEWLRLALIVAAGLLFVGAVLGLAVLVSTLTRRSSTSFLCLLVLWILAVMIVPRAAVLGAARAVDVPSVDEHLSQRSRLRAQLWREDRQKINAFFSETMDGDDPSGEDPAARMAALNGKIQELGERRDRELSALDGRLGEERRNRQARQHALAFGLARLSPTAAFSLAAARLAGTSLLLPDHFAAQARVYQESYERFQKEKTGGRSSGGITLIVRTGDEEEPGPIDPRELPAFDYQPPPAAELLRGATFDLGLLALFNLLFYAGAFVSFLRTDVR